MTNSQSKLAPEGDVGNRLIFLTDVLYKVIQDRDVIRNVFKNLDEIESKEERLYHKVVFDLHKTIKSKVKVPINKKTRSLNVAISVAIISAEALRQNNLLK